MIPDVGLCFVKMIQDVGLCFVALSARRPKCGAKSGAPPCTNPVLRRDPTYYSYNFHKSGTSCE